MSYGNLLLCTYVRTYGLVFSERSERPRVEIEREREIFPSQLAFGIIVWREREREKEKWYAHRGEKKESDRLLLVT